MSEVIWSIFKIFAAIFLVLLNAFFVGAEFSFVKVRKTRLVELAEKGSKTADTALGVTSSLNEYLSACQLGITLASLGLGWLGEPAIAGLLDPLFKGITGWTEVYTHSISIIIAFVIITFLHIVLGELVPKSLAIQKPESIALSTAGLLKLFYRIFYPAIWALNAIANLLLHLGGVRQGNEGDLGHTEKELRMLVEVSQRHGHLDKMEGKLLDNVFEFSDRVVSEVMVPRQDMICIFAGQSFANIMEVVKQYGHTRFPLCEGEKDNVIGLIHMRDLFDLGDNASTGNITQFKREIIVAPENMPISHLVQKMRSERNHMAVVVDEFGGTAGLVTIEDLVEELVGEIYDEFDTDQPSIKKVGEQDYEINGRVLLEEVSDILDVRLDEKNVATIGGFVFSKLGRRPTAGDEIFAGGYCFQVLEISGIRITKVLAVKRG
ncbi:hemolysin family protein [Metallumcola ferriviriculae]|uniref:Hemolysin family protein n=1 Tax=Metallumcola ferriviriculae TaxID=3039180 RepID=A0AAU0USZ5_9FIRM|nr:hemolysin family protein [Desulfitibacteraceae bacterium MK1]